MADQLVVADARLRAESRFKRSEQMKAEAHKALAQVEADRRATLEKTARLRALRLAKEAVDRQAAIDDASNRTAKSKAPRPSVRRGAATRSA